MSKKIKNELEQKAIQSQYCYEMLKDVVDINDSIPITFCMNSNRAKQMKNACFKNNPFPKYKVVLLLRRLAAVNKLFKEENVLQTPPTAAALSACGSLATEIGMLRNDIKELNSDIFCDIGFAGLQAIRLFMETSTDKDFSMQRFNSCINVNNALNGSSYKYLTKNNRYFSFHLYYENQKEKMIKALKIDKPAKEFTMDSISKDRAMLKNLVGNLDSYELENLAFDCEASGCVLRSRKEWEETELGQAVMKMPLVDVKKINDTEPKVYPKTNDKGPLSGIKVLDLTHIIAGPACSRILAEYGADVLLVRRGDFNNQEQAFLELDGWAGKHSIQLDLNEEKALERIKTLIKEADVIVYSYQRGCFDKFGLSEEEILQINPNLIYANLNCFSDTVWADRPGWAPLAEDITGLSIRNGSNDKPKNLNGVPLDYIPGTILALGVLDAIKKSMTVGGSYSVFTSLARGAQWLHECTDKCQNIDKKNFSTKVISDKDFDLWNDVLQMVDNNAVGTVGFPSPGIIVPNNPNIVENMRFTDGNTDWNQK